MGKRVETKEVEKKVSLENKLCRVAKSREKRYVGLKICDLDIRSNGMGLCLC